MNKYITFCAYEGCKNTDCLRFYKNAPKNNSISWFAVRPKENGLCEYVLYNNDKE